ncbi:tetratricopeptide repeat protein [Motiliproteus sp. SC1-56]|uniref:tetratricopeptide repeat protein n=1 Tax=Motiliproteus sp. SC1-56 TaxID=2799565 RepID=UPI001A90799E|nr:tetratricopeptide repeat protein [Motiliproteus sp. SC1-56]
MVRSLVCLTLAGLLAACATTSPPTVPVEERGLPQGAPPAPVVPDEPRLPPEPAGEMAPAPGYPVTPVPAPKPLPLPEPLPRTPSDSQPSGALLALLEQAEARHQAGQPQQALALLERAQRIAPREPLVYLQLARLRLDLGDRVRAQQLARKGLALSADPNMREAFRVLLRQSSP